MSSECTSLDGEHGAGGSQSIANYWCVMPGRGLVVGPTCTNENDLGICYQAATRDVCYEIGGQLFGGDRWCYRPGGPSTGGDYSVVGPTVPRRGSSAGHAIPLSRRFRSPVLCEFACVTCAFRGQCHDGTCYTAGTAQAYSALSQTSTYVGSIQSQ